MSEPAVGKEFQCKAAVIKVTSIRDGYVWSDATNIRPTKKSKPVPICTTIADWNRLIEIGLIWPKPNLGTV